MKIKNIENDYFIDVDDETLAILEEQGDRSFTEVFNNTNSTRELAFKILNLFLLGAGGSFLLLTQQAKVSFLSVGLLTFCIGWSLCSLSVVLKCIKRVDRPLKTTDPQSSYLSVYKELNDDDYNYFNSIGYTGERKSLPVFKRYRLGTLQVAIQEMEEINEKIANSLNNTIIASSATPLAGIALSLLHYFFLGF